MTTADIRDLDARAVRASVDLVAGITAVDLGRPTPCAEWTLGHLLAHVTVQHKGFAAAAAGRGADPEAWKVTAPGSDPVAAYAIAAELLIAAFVEPGALEREFSLPEIIPGVEFPAGRRFPSPRLCPRVSGGCGPAPSGRVCLAGLTLARWTGSWPCSAGRRSCGRPLARRDACQIWPNRRSPASPRPGTM